MITPNEYGDAIEAALQAAFPENKIYREVVPTGFERPSFSVECEKFSAVSNFDTDSVEIDTNFSVRCFVAVDSYHYSQFADLYKRAMTVMGLFVPGFIRVTDPASGAKRAPKVTALTSGSLGTDYAEVKVSFALSLDRAEFETVPEVDTMQTVTVRGL